ncbi:hypothetical protein QBZ16_001437 [Prototheca wickerhamii]|uniref:Autophagy-related protein 9 n=1 Tax=Prototheca wickerhamii TaxID=3111 RepID=A0AAD9IDI4_PROWI|nr:hypothetical protein QBZ16_001437 [Prototheca wickerhamii]
MDDEGEPLRYLEGHSHVPDAYEKLLEGEREVDWQVVPNLDTFFTDVYTYWSQKGYWVIVISAVLEFLALGFAVFISVGMLLFVDLRGLKADCIREDTCDIWDAKLVRDVVVMVEVGHFFHNKLGISERRIKTITWPEVARRLHQVQASTRLCATRDLTEHDIILRVMRRDNYIIGMLNQGVLALHVPIPGLRGRVFFTQMLQWNIKACIFTNMFDENFRIRADFLDPVAGTAKLQRRFRWVAALNLALSPFLLAFLFMYFFMKKAEEMYHHPSSLGARYWTPLAKWTLREFNELPHFLNHRRVGVGLLNASNAAAEKYIMQFPMPVVSHVARFVAFVAGSFAALLLLLTLVDGRLLERDLLGRHIVWWLAVLGVVLAISRAFIAEGTTAFDPETAMSEVVANTHYLPRHWRGRAHAREVQESFQALFQFKALVFAEEIGSILLTPLMLWHSLAGCSGAIVHFLRDNTEFVEGIGDVCSMAAFAFPRHGNAHYGSAYDAPKSLRTRQGKLEKSFLSFVATYPTWQPTGAGQALLRSVEAAPLRDSWAAASGGALDASASQMGPGLSLSLGAASAPDDAGWGAEQRVLRSQVLLQSLYDAQAPFCPPQEAWDGSPNGHALVAPPRHEAQEGVMAARGNLGMELAKLLAGAAIGGVLAYALATRRRSREGTYMIVVQLKFKTEAAREKFEEGYRHLAVHAKENEPETLFFELSVSEDDPKRLISVERYSTKEALTDVHSTSEPVQNLLHQIGEMGSDVFVLAVRLKTETVEQRDEIIRLFTPLAQYVQEHESETLSYQLAIADTDPTLIQIYERYDAGARYASKAALTELHHSSEAYKTFKAAIAELPFPVEKSGQSYFEEAIGYM